FCTSLCEKSCCDGSGGPVKDQYQSWKSSTYKSDDKAFRSDKYGAFGEYGIDTVRIGNSQQIVVPGIRFGMASETGTDYGDFPADGVLGLSTFAAGLDSTKEKPFIQQLVDSGVLEKSLYTLYLAADAKAELSGVVTYGDVDNQHCGGQVSYTRMDKQNGLFEVRNISVGSAYQYSQGLSARVFSDFTKDFIGVAWDEAYAVAKAFRRQDRHPHDTDDFCVLNIEKSDNWVFGSPLARSYCQVVDIGGEQIGFSAQKLT
ncbi:aspartyle protease precursor, partial [Aphelenchoides avenae]